MIFGRYVFKLANNHDPDSLSSRLRNRRFQLFTAMMSGIPGTIRILDVGGTAEFWARHLDTIKANVEVTLLNLHFARQPPLPRVAYVAGDARRMTMFSDAQFDLCLSNSVIEHFSTLRDQLNAANEIRRVARGYFVQTPNIYFPLEPHFLVLGWQFAPISLRTRLLQMRDWGWMKRVEDSAKARKAVESISLLNIRRLSGLFPDANIHRERLGPFTKSLIAWRPIN
jgi:hypothetical protein